MSKKRTKSLLLPWQLQEETSNFEKRTKQSWTLDTMVALKYAASLGKESTVWGVCVCPLPPFQTGQPEKVHKFAEKGVVQSDSHSSPLSPLSNRRGKGENGFTIAGIELHSMSLSVSFLFNVLLFPPPKKETKKAALVKGRRRKGRSNILRLSFFSLSLSFLGDGGRWFDSGRRRRRRLRGGRRRMQIVVKYPPLRVLLSSPSDRYTNIRVTKKTRRKSGTEMEISPPPQWSGSSGIEESSSVLREKSYLFGGGGFYRISPPDIVFPKETKIKWRGGNIRTKQEGKGNEKSEEEENDIGSADWGKKKPIQRKKKEQSSPFIDASISANEEWRKRSEMKKTSCCERRRKEGEGKKETRNSCWLEVLIRRAGVGGRGRTEEGPTTSVWYVPRRHEGNTLVTAADTIPPSRPSPRKRKKRRRPPSSWVAFAGGRRAEEKGELQECTQQWSTAWPCSLPYRRIVKNLFFRHTFFW